MSTNRRKPTFDGWAHVASQVRLAGQRDLAAGHISGRESALTPPADFVQQVVSLAEDPLVRAVSGSDQESERLVAWAAGLALAASLLVSIWNWQLLEVVWTDPGPPVEWTVNVEPPL